MAMDERMQWLMVELDLELMNRRMKDMGMIKAKQNPSIFLKTSVSQIETAKAKAKAEKQNQDRINGRKSVSEMEKQEDLHHINKKQKMEKEEEEEEEAAIAKAPQSPSKAIMGTNDPSLPWLPPEVEYCWFWP